MLVDQEKIRRIKKGLLPKSGDGYCFIRLIDYYDTTDWEDLRTQTLQRDGGVCTKCGTQYDLEVHHVRYPETFFIGKHKYINIENDVLENLDTLCRQHHADRHPHLNAGGAGSGKPTSLYEKESPPSEIDFRIVTFKGDDPSEPDEDSSGFPDSA